MPPEVLDRLAAPRRQPERLGELDEVRVREVDAEVAAELLVLLPDDRAVLAVLPHDVHRRRPEALGGLELLHVHEEAAVAVDGHHLALGVHELRRDPARHGEAHPGQAVGDDHRVRLVRGEHPRDPQLVQADVGDEHVLAPERLPDLPQRARRLHRELRIILCTLEPAEDEVAQAGIAAGMRDVPRLLGQARQHVVDVADQLDLGREERVDLRRDRVDDDDLLVALGVPVRGRVLDEVVADREHDVGVLEPGEGVVARGQADGAERPRVGRSP